MAPVHDEVLTLLVYHDLINVGCGGKTKVLIILDLSSPSGWVIPTGPISKMAL